MTKTKILLTKIKEDKDYKFSRNDFNLFLGKILTVKKSENYYIFSYYATSKKTSDSLIAKYEIHFTSHLIKDYFTPLERRNLQLEVDNDKLTFADFIEKMQTCLLKDPKCQASSEIRLLESKINNLVI